MTDEHVVSDAPEASPAVTEKPGMLNHAPWWLISSGIHVVLLLAAMLIYVERAMAVEGEGVIISSSSASQLIQPDPERERDVFKNKGIVDDGPNTSVNDDPIIFYPDAEDGDHNESANGEDYHQMKGDGKQYLSYTPGESATGFRGRQAGKNPGVYDAMGVGGGGGGAGRHGDKWGGRKNIRKRGPNGSQVATESAVLAALRWLARHQNADGSWGAEGFKHECKAGACSGAGDKEFDTGVTGLSLLAFLGSGYTHLSKDVFVDPVEPTRQLNFGAVCKKAEQWLMKHQNPDGSIGENGPRLMYNHSIGALALTEAYGMTSAELLKVPAQKAIDFIVAAQNPGRGWRYTPKCGDNDCSVTGWCVMALKSAELSELTFPRSCYDGAVAWLNEATEDGGYYRTGYTAKSTGKVYEPGKNEKWDDHAALSAVSVMCRIFVNKNKREPALTAVTLLTSDVPEWKEHKIDFYYWYYASLALFQYDGPDGGSWKKWNEPMKTALVTHQRTGKDGCTNGSWDPEVDRWGHAGGRVYATAINALTLEVYYRYANVFGGKK